MQKLISAAVAALLALPMTVLSAAESPFPGIETLMTPEERAAAGIDGLSPAQLDALNRWLGTYLGEPEAVPVVESAPQAAQQATTNTSAAPREYGAPPPEFQPFTSRIKGEFTGWSGNTRFELENGELYEQRRPGRWRTQLVNPEVRISKNFLGAYDLEIVAEGRSIGVKRLR